MTVFGNETIGDPFPKPGACGFNWTNLNTTDVQNYFIALPLEHEYNNGKKCGLCLRIQCKCNQRKEGRRGACYAGGVLGHDATEAIAMVVDSCPKCAAGDVDVSGSEYISHHIR